MMLSNIEGYSLVKIGNLTKGEGNCFDISAIMYNPHISGSIRNMGINQRMNKRSITIR